MVRALGWTSRPVTAARRAGPHIYEVFTPTGHRYRSESPPPIGALPPEVDLRIAALQRSGRLVA
jgi:hypothetical protein